MTEIMGEANPGFNLWTSAHGFHHIELTRSPGWRIFWIVLITLSSVALVGCVIYYFYYVFAFAVYSRFLLESPSSVSWPTTIVCDRQMFSATKMAQVPLMSPSHASLLSWTVNPRLSRPDVMNNTRVAQMTADINTILARPDFNRISYGSSGALSGGPIEQLLRAVAPNCTQLILQCTIGKAILTGWDCCRLYFDPNPYFTQSGTCYSTRGAPQRHQARAAGDSSSFTIVTMHDITNTFDPLFVSPELLGANGLTVAVVDDEVTPQAAVSSRGLSVAAGQMVSVGLSRMVVDEGDLGWSAIARQRCVMPGERSPRWVDVDLNYGVSYSYGYTMDSCTMISKQEMLARELFFCTYSPLVGDNELRCNANQSVSYFRSFLDSNNTGTPDIPIFSIDSKPGLRRRFEKPCMPDCSQDRYTMNPTFTPYTDVQRQALQTQVTGSGQAIQGSNPNTVTLNLFLRSMEYQHIYNFPENGVQFVAELGGLMCFFLGMSIISVIECLCFCCGCGCRDNRETSDEEKRQLDAPDG